MSEVEFFTTDEPEGPPAELAESAAGVRLLPRWARFAAMGAAVLGTGTALVLTGQSAPPAPQPVLPTVHIGPLHEHDPSLHHLLGPNTGGYLY